MSASRINLIVFNTILPPFPQKPYIPAVCAPMLLTELSLGCQTIPLLTSLISTGQSFHTLTFNLVTIYELCSERSRTKKFDLVEQVAAMGDGRSGERSNADFKL